MRMGVIMGLSRLLSPRGWGDALRDARTSLTMEVCAVNRAVVAPEPPAGLVTRRSSGTHTDIARCGTTTPASTLPLLCVSLKLSLPAECLLFGTSPVVVVVAAAAASHCLFGDLNPVGLALQAATCRSAAASEAEAGRLEAFAAHCKRLLSRKWDTMHTHISARVCHKQTKRNKDKKYSCKVHSPRGGHHFLWRCAHAQCV